MNTPRNAKTARGGQRFYSWRNETFWSATTIINGGVPKPALLPWGIKSTAEGAVMQRDVFKAMLDACTTPKDCARGEFCETCDQAIRWLKAIPYSKRDRAADLGSLIHAWIEADRLEKPMPKVSDQVAPYLTSFRQFITDFSPQYEAAEASVYNRSQSYAGTLDAIVTLQLPLSEVPQTYILDAKTGRDIYPEVGLQLAAYRMAEFIGMPDGSEEPMPQVDGGLALHLTPEGYRLIEVDVSDEVYRAFLFAREVYRFCLETSKTVLGPEYGSRAKTEAVA
jgi:hypothetical protein